MGLYVLPLSPNDDPRQPIDIGDCPKIVDLVTNCCPKTFESSPVEPHMGADQGYPEIDTGTLALVAGVHIERKVEWD